jgi:hypothetical protein
MVNTEVERYSDVDPAEVPSAAWGWSKINHRVWYATGIFIILFLVGMLHGNHVGRVEDWWLLAFAVGIAVVIVRDIVMRRRGLLR